MNIWLALGGLLGLGAVMAGASADHMLQLHIASSEYQAFMTAVRYQMWHAMVLVFLSLSSARHSRILRLACLSFVIGILFFCGGIYSMVLIPLPDARYLVPIGGIAFMIGWIYIAFLGVRYAKYGNSKM